MLTGSSSIRRDPNVRFLAAFNGVVKRARWGRENKGFVEAASPPPPVLLRNGEAGQWQAVLSIDVKRVCTNVYVLSRTRRTGPRFTTNSFGLVKALPRRKWLVDKWLC